LPYFFAIFIGDISINVVNLKSGCYVNRACLSIRVMDNSPTRRFAAETRTRDTRRGSCAEEIQHVGDWAGSNNLRD